MTRTIDTADVVVIGGGVAGLSCAMQLALRGQRTIVLEREHFGNGSTGRAAGLLGQLRGTAAHTRLLIDSLALVKELERRAGVEIYVQTGSLRIAETPERAHEIRNLVAMGKTIDFQIDLMPIDEVARRLPYMKTDDLIEACWCPTDGHLQPAELVAAYLQVGRRSGALYRHHCPVEGLVVRGGRVQAVRVADGLYEAPVVVNAAGPWSYLVADLAAATLPTAAIGHFYLATKPQPEHPVDRLSPAVRNRHHRIYTRPDAGGLIVGMYEAEPLEYRMEERPVDFDMSTMKAARDSYHVALLIHSAQQRFAWINERTPMTVTHGIMTFTPDGQPVCGELPGLNGLYHCSGFSGHGIVESPVIGRIMADLILDGATPYDTRALAAERFVHLPGYGARDEIRVKCRQMAASYYGQVEGGAAGERA